MTQSIISVAVVTVVVVVIAILFPIIVLIVIVVAKKTRKNQSSSGEHITNVCVSVELSWFWCRSWTGTSWYLRHWNWASESRLQQSTCLWWKWILISYIAKQNLARCLRIVQLPHISDFQTANSLCAFKTFRTLSHLILLPSSFSSMIKYMKKAIVGLFFTNIMSYTV